MKVWCDATTGKHMRYAVAIARRLRSKGHEVLITTREHPDTIPLAKILGEEVAVMGVYGGKSRYCKLLNSVRRQEGLLERFNVEGNPDVVISHGSVEAPRVALGLGFPSICTWDSPHAKAVSRLVLPLATYIVASKSMNRYFLERNATHTHQKSFFDGVDELAWLDQAVDSPSISGCPIVYRDFECEASYSPESFVNNGVVVEQLESIGTVTRLRRRPEQYVDALPLVKRAGLVVGFGGTLGREAALLGTASLIIDIGVVAHNASKLLAEHGFPIYFCTLSTLSKVIKDINVEGQDVQDKIAKLENPLDVIERVVEDIPKSGGK